MFVVTLTRGIGYTFLIINLNFAVLPQNQMLIAQSKALLQRYILIQKVLKNIRRFRSYRHLKNSKMELWILTNSNNWNTRYTVLNLVREKIK